MHAKKKIVFLSDLHSYCYGKNNCKLLNAIKREKPDLILVAGDMIVGRPGDSTEVAENLLIRLPEICDVYYAKSCIKRKRQNSYDGIKQ